MTTTQPEPVLSAEDVAVWKRWEATFALRARSREFRRRVDEAKRIAARELERASAPCVAWSAGKDSTALAHLVAVELATTHVTLVREKDDLDYAGAEEYVTALAASWGAPLTIVRPDVSPAEWVAARARNMSLGDDIHSRSAGLSKACFYGVMERANQNHDLVMMGLRAEESGLRSQLIRRKGASYALKSGERRAHPIGALTGLDVLTYLHAVGVEPLHVYRCVAFLHATEPWMIRKSWWLPGISARHGQVAWLRRYYPSLYERAKRLFGNAASFT